jgi:hypothetical protein
VDAVYAGAVIALNGAVPQIGRFGHISKVRPAVVEAIAVDVVYLVQRPIAGLEQEGEAVSHVV